MAVPEYIKVFTDKLSEADRANKKFLDERAPKPAYTIRPMTLKEPGTSSPGFGGSTEWLAGYTGGQGQAAPGVSGGSPFPLPLPTMPGSRQEEIDRRALAARAGTDKGLLRNLNDFTGMTARDISTRKILQEHILNPSTQREMQYDYQGFPMVYASEAEMPEYWKGRQALYQKGTAFVADPVLKALGQKPYEEQPENVRSIISMVEEMLVQAVGEGAAWKGAGKMMYADINRDFEKDWNKINGDARLNYSIDQAQPDLPFAAKQAAAAQTKDYARRYYTEGRLGGVSTSYTPAEGKSQLGTKPEDQPQQPSRVPKYTVVGQETAAQKAMAGLINLATDETGAIGKPKKPVTPPGQLGMPGVTTQPTQPEMFAEFGGAGTGGQKPGLMDAAKLTEQAAARAEAERLTKLGQAATEITKGGNENDIKRQALEAIRKQITEGHAGGVTRPAENKPGETVYDNNPGGKETAKTTVTKTAAPPLGTPNVTPPAQTTGSGIKPNKSQTGTIQPGLSNYVDIKTEYDKLVARNAPEADYQSLYARIAKNDTGVAEEQGVWEGGSGWKSKIEAYLESLKAKETETASTPPPPITPKPPVTEAVQPEGKYPKAAQSGKPAVIEVKAAMAKLKEALTAQKYELQQKADVKNLRIEAVKQRFLDMVQQYIPEEIQGRFLRSMKDIETGDQLLKQIDRMQDILAVYEAKIARQEQLKQNREEIARMKQEIEQQLLKQKEYGEKQQAEVSAERIAAVKDRLVDIIKQTVPKEGQGRFLTAVKNVRTGKQLLRALDMAARVANEYDIQETKRDIYKEIATTAVKGGKGKFTADIQRKLDIFRKALRASADSRQNMILDNSGKALAGRITVQEAQERNHLIRLADLSGRDVIGLNDVLNQIKQFKATGKLVRLAEVQVARRERIGYSTTEDAITDLAASLTPRKGYSEKPISGHKTFGELAHEVIDSVSVRADKMQRALFEMDGATYDGKMSNVFIKPTSQAAEGEAGLLQNWQNELKKFVKDSGVDIGKLAGRKLIQTDGVGLTSTDRITVYMQSKNEQGTNHLTEGNKYSQEFIDNVVASLTPEEKAFGDFLLKHYEEQKAIIAPVYELIYGIPFPAVDNYSPLIIDRKEVGGGTEHADALDIMKQEADNAGINRGFTKERQPGSAQPIMLDAISIYLRNMMDVAHFVAYAPTVYDLNTILKSKEMHDAVIRHSSASVYGIMNKWLNDTASNDSSRIKNVADQAARFMRQNSTSAVLFGNILSSLKQTISLNTSIAEVGEIPMLRGLIANTADYKGTLELMRKYSPVAAERVTQSISRQRVAFKNATQMLKGKRSAQEIGMFLTGFIDENAVSITWRAAYESYLKKHPGQEQAAATNATDVASRTQNWNLTKDLSEYYRLGELGKLVTMFTQEQNQQYNYIRHDIIGKAIHGKINPFEAARRMFWAFVIPALLMGIISRARVPKTWDEAGRDIAVQAIGLIPILGPFLQSGLGGYQYGGAITTELIEGMQNITYSLGSGKWLNVAEDTATFAGMMLGLPVNQAKRLYQAYEAYPKEGVGAWREAVYGKTQAAKQRKEGVNKYQDEIDRLLGESGAAGNAPPSGPNWLESLLGRKTATQPAYASPTPTPELVPAATPTPGAGRNRIRMNLTE